VPFIQPGRWGEVLARVDVTLEKKGGKLRPSSITGELLPSDKSVAADPEVARIAAPHDAHARAYMDQTVAVSDAPFPAAGARLGDSALLELVSETMRSATKADLSMASLIPGGRYAGLPAGEIKVRDVYALYPYENQLVVVEVDGAAVRSLLEHAAEFYGTATWSDGKLVLTPKPGMIAYNFDAIEGVSYRIDPTSPVGSRVKDLAYGGAPLKETDRFTMAVNSYRAQGAGGYRALKGSKVVRVYSDEIRELLIEAVRKRGRISPRWDHNWVVAPDAAWTPDAFAPRAN
jgi:2',3'-cyclic-nucleotide 2'-phosphodiesterase/3'-nucleotidase